ncbi:hypothetical protein N825_30665 [Skermanella stibiiresistens SB22]|uniref:Uncharacterized protein n=1 Tax=Skermanella stibiiresistens SB22 TaxID=1385369 RepID=W9H5B6_9PROT|nr:hypothetical protein [Skermanella stibiiresistens]EWY41224.1 hypothetical protein N825_30665 [Skermanella stibiiresistens SB22]
MWEDKAFLGSLLGGALGGAMLTALANTALNRVGLRSHDLSARTDDLCRDIERLAVAGVGLWMTPAFDLGVEGVRLRAEIMGLQRRIELWLDLLDRESWLFRFDADTDLIGFFESVTGGAFGEPDRVAEPFRCQDIQRRAAGLVVTVRRSRRTLLHGLF